MVTNIYFSLKNSKRLIITIVLVMCLYSKLLQAHNIPPHFFFAACEKLKTMPNDIKSLTIRGHYYYNNSEYNKALLDLRKVYKLTTTDIQVCLTLSFCHARLGQYKKALVLLQNFLKPSNRQRYFHIPDFRMAYWERAQIYMRLKRNTDAWHDSQVALEFFPNNWSILLKSAMLAQRLKKKQEAIQLYTKALTQFPSSSCENYLSRLLILLVQQKKFIAAHDILQKYAVALDDDPMPLYYKGMIAKYYQKRQQSFRIFMEKALIRAEKIIARGEGYQLEGKFWKVRILIEFKKYLEALALLNRTIIDEPEHANLYLLRAQIYRTLGKKKQYLQDLQINRLLLTTVGEDWLKLALFPLPNTIIKSKKRLRRKK